jgi:hypothetical protein
MVRFTNVMHRRRNYEGKKNTFKKQLTRWGWVRKLLRLRSTEKKASDYTFIGNNFDGSSPGEIPNVTSFVDTEMDDTVAYPEHDLILAGLQELELERSQILNRCSSQDGVTGSSQNKQMKLKADDTVGVYSRDAFLLVVETGSTEEHIDNEDDAISEENSSNLSHSQDCSTAVKNTRLVMMDSIFLASSDDESDYDEYSQDIDSLFDDECVEIVEFL